MSDRHSLRNGIIASTVGPLLTALIVWIWSEVKGIPYLTLLRRIGWLVTSEIPIPFWLITIILVLGGVLARGLLKKRVMREEIESGPSLPPWHSNSDDPVGKIADRIMEMFKSQDQQTIYGEQLRLLEFGSRLQIDEALARLVAAKMIESASYHDLDQFILLPRGRHFLVR